MLFQGPTGLNMPYALAIPKRTGCERHSFCECPSTTRAASSRRVKLGADGVQQVPVLQVEIEAFHTNTSNYSRPRSMRFNKLSGGISRDATCPRKSKCTLFCTDSHGVTAVKVWQISPREKSNS